MKFITNLEWTKIKKIIIILLLSILLVYITIRLISINNEINNPIENKQEQTDKMFVGENDGTYKTQ
jgi:uncharacterized protein YpmS